MLSILSTSHIYTEPFNVESKTKGMISGLYQDFLRPKSRARFQTPPSEIVPMHDFVEKCTISCRPSFWEGRCPRCRGAPRVASGDSCRAGAASVAPARRGRCCRSAADERGERTGRGGVGARGAARRRACGWLRVRPSGPVAMWSSLARDRRAARRLYVVVCTSVDSTAV